ncbi:transcription elongation factor GreA [Candidatus Roizmanbacteria bacterium RIFCSPHIGHO2_02_FULL_37_13b]|uniref:Transcription elongation factor GreA n=1 Tax=Candidatus Roizmanbacteria bacterium RIFCSPLOWO2_02_FULL_36_11 TaxID=1802071 RepID=A0A1F7JCC2_9BACT|nr:MAG: transcription elongation factor GreA [Candidatus Roizmanbacteria bacterium RIFCSPHIGHO2_02_FULL_37_13b]OGK53254.1 MAG: transcription elongation factor GreA [Candidatus Roizmanbacteria bacterium RIFCSPLOWO2_02_FULL_36_11]
MLNKVILTKEGFEKLNQELDVLKNQKRPQAVETLKKAREMGDLSENNAYTSAKEELGFVDSRILELEDKLNNAQIMEENNNSSHVVIGSIVDVSSDNQVFTYTIVSQEESDLQHNKISNKSPLGMSLMGKKKNDIVDVVTPINVDRYKIVSIK